MRFRYSSWILVKLIIVASVASGPVLGLSIQGDPELLKTVATRNRANYEALLTWAGEATEEITSTRGDGYDYLVRSDVTFAYDRARTAVRLHRGLEELHVPG